METTRPKCGIDDCNNLAKGTRKNTSFGKYCSKHYERKRNWGTFYADSNYQKHKIENLIPTPDFVDVGDRYYLTVHAWVNRRYGKAKKCESKRCLNISQKYEWANINKKYTRNIDEWKQLCISCHRRFDNGHNGII